jgi:hypothetical protein
MIQLHGQRNDKGLVTRNVRITGKRWHNHLEAEIRIGDEGNQVSSWPLADLGERWSDKSIGDNNISVPSFIFSGAPNFHHSRTKLGTKVRIWDPKPRYPRDGCRIKR